MLYLLDHLKSILHLLLELLFQGNHTMNVHWFVLVLSTLFVSHQLFPQIAILTFRCLMSEWSVMLDRYELV